MSIHHAPPPAPTPHPHTDPRKCIISIMHQHNNSILQSTSTKETYELPRDKTNEMICAPSEDSDQPGHPPSLIRIFAVRRKKGWILSYPLSAQRRLRSDWADAQADLSLCAQGRLRSAWASAQSDQSLCCPQEERLDS